MFFIHFKAVPLPHFFCLAFPLPNICLNPTGKSLFLCSSTYFALYHIITQTHIVTPLQFPHCSTKVRLYSFLYHVLIIQKYYRNSSEFPSRAPIHPF